MAQVRKGNSLEVRCTIFVESFTTSSGACKNANSPCAQRTEVVSNCCTFCDAAFSKDGRTTAPSATSLVGLFAKQRTLLRPSLVKRLARPTALKIWARDFTTIKQGSLHYTPEHCLVHGGFPLFWWKKPCFKWLQNGDLLRSPVEATPLVAQRRAN